MKRMMSELRLSIGIFLLISLGFISIAESQQLLRGHVPSAIAKFNLQPIGRLESTRQLHLTIGMPLHNQGSLTDLLQQLYDPASPNFRKYLTTEQFTAQFCPTEQEYQAVIAFVKANGLTVTGTHPNRMLLNISGSVSDIEKIFQVKMQTYKHPTEQRTFFAPDVEPTVPSGLSIVDIAGLNNYARTKPKKIGQSTTTAGYGSSPGGCFWGNDFRAAYAPDVSPSLNGTGQIVGLLEFGSYKASDITQYESLTGILPNVPLQNVVVDTTGNTIPLDDYSQKEVTLDIEMAISMAPKLSKVIVYQAPYDSIGTFSAWHTMLNKMANDNLAKQMSCSWWIPDMNGGYGSNDYDPVADQIFIQMAVQGQSFFNASGDEGAYPLGQYIGFPDGSPYITQVGGTYLATASPGGPYSWETTWYYIGVGGAVEGSGGGPSTTYPLPSYQQGICNGANGASRTNRNVPDVALVATNIYTFYDDTARENGSGTSYAAPLWAGYTALINQQAVASGKPTVGFLNPLLYLIGEGSNDTLDFHDINDGSTNGIYRAVNGYDLCTGWGTPKGQSLINDIISLRNFSTTVYQYKKDGISSVDSIGRWTSSGFINYQAPAKNLQFYIGRDEVLRGTQNMLSGQKYNNWSINTSKQSDVTNHHIFSIQNTSDIFTSNLDSVMNATIQAQGDGVTLGSVWFQDPWLIDSADAWRGGALMNRGMSAPFYSIAPAQYNIGITSRNGGVFLNQGGVPPNLTPPYYSISFPTQSVSVGGTNHKLYFQNWSATGATVQNSVSSQTPVVFTSNNAVVTANVKGSLLSNNASAFSDNGQRKLVRTHDGWLHQVYESMDHVWLEESTDQGNTWFIGNGGQPLDNYRGKCPSIDWHYNTAANYSAVVVTFQQQSGSSYTIPYAVFMYTNGSYVRQTLDIAGPLYTEPARGDQYASINANPNIAWGGQSYCFVLSFERKSTNGMQPGIYWMYGLMYERGIMAPINYNGGRYYAGPIWVSGTNRNSITATVNLNKASTYPSDFDIVYQQYDSGSIQDAMLSCAYDNRDGEWQWRPSQTLPTPILSSSTGRSNYKPSMVQMYDANIRVCWIRDLNGDGSAPYNVNVVYWNSAYPSQYSIYGFLAQSVSLNVRDDNAKTYYAFSQNSMSGQWENYISDGSSYVKLNTAGRDVQLSNGPLSGTSSLMYTSSFYPFTLPYYFINAGTIGTQLQKATSDPITYGRGTVLVKGDVEFSYSLKSLTVDNTNIKFIDLPANKTDTARTFRRLGEKSLYYPSIDSLNTVLLSEPFTINNNSTISISELSGFVDTVAAIKVLGSNGYVAYKLDLVDNAANKTLAAIKGVKFTSATVSSCKLSASSLNVSKLGTKTVRIKITISTNVDDLQGSLMNEYGTVNTNALAKLAPNEIVLQSPEIVTAYALGQNYPNPFNPSTTIQYQIPSAGHVTMKVFDMLGREVATLVDGLKEVGSYSATFDGARLASGVYIMRLTATPGDGSKPFVQVKKMLMIK